jgi:hypothetical protein
VNRIESNPARRSLFSQYLLSRSSQVFVKEADLLHDGADPVGHFAEAMAFIAKQDVLDS